MQSREGYKSQALVPGGRNLARRQADMGFDAATDMESMNRYKGTGDGASQVDDETERWD